MKLNKNLISTEPESVLEGEVQLKLLFVEPPKDYWFVMGEYLPPPYGILQLASFIENKHKDVEIQVLDCNAEGLDWNGLEKRMESFNPDMVASSALATCNTYVSVRTLELAKKVNPDVVTVAGGQHFTVMTEESLKTYPEIDVIVRGEGEQTLAELTQRVSNGHPFSDVKGVSFRNKGQIIHEPARPLIENLDSLPFPGYKFVENLVHKYHFTAMAGKKTRYAMIEGSRGCPHQCTFCTQWRHWGSKWRIKSPKRIADEFEFCYENYGSRFLWLTDDNYGLGKRANELSDELISRGFSDDIIWFMQVRCDDVVKHADVLPKMRKSGLRWVLLGVESNSSSTLDSFRKETAPEDSKKAVRLLKKSDIFSQGMFIIGQRKDTAQSIENLREFSNELDPDLAIFAILTPFPGTAVYEEAKQNGWIEDWNWANYDMVHAIMPTERLSAKEVQEELYKCYRSFFGSWSRRVGGIFSRKALKRRLYMYMASQGIVNQVKSLI
ncbi:MAG: B12-binding domain-containing radical SAM protein [Candidatus Bathyarchaeota archaeon]|nr:B12-binding domain-containing radical SAM protein [Candidatus Bathyarchaeum sp.]